MPLAHLAKYASQLPLRLGFFFSRRRDLGVGLLVLSRFGNENMARDARKSRADTITSPSHQAPIHRGSVGVILGSTDRSAYRLVQSEPKMKPSAGPRILTPMVMAK